MRVNGVNTNNDFRLYHYPMWAAKATCNYITTKVIQVVKKVWATALYPISSWESNNGRVNDLPSILKNRVVGHFSKIELNESTEKLKEKIGNVANNSVNQLTKEEEEFVRTLFDIEPSSITADHHPIGKDSIQTVIMPQSPTVQAASEKIDTPSSLQGDLKGTSTTNGVRFQSKNHFHNILQSDVNGGRAFGARQINFSTSSEAGEQKNATVVGQEPFTDLNAKKPENKTEQLQAFMKTSLDVWS